MPTMTARIRPNATAEPELEPLPASPPVVGGDGELEPAAGAAACSPSGEPDDVALAGRLLAPRTVVDVTPVPDVAAGAAVEVLEAAPAAAVVVGQVAAVPPPEVTGAVVAVGEPLMEPADAVTGGAGRVVGGAVVGGGAAAASVPEPARRGEAPLVPQRQPSTSPSRTVTAPAPMLL